MSTIVSDPGRADPHRAVYIMSRDNILEADSDADRTLDPDLPVRQANLALEAAFPDLQRNLVVMIEADDAFDARDAAEELSAMLRADRERYPVLLSNGNLLERRDLGNGRHRVLWHDPFPKPSYLFALVAGVLVSGLVTDVATAPVANCDLTFDDVVTGEDALQWAVETARCLDVEECP